MSEIVTKLQFSQLVGRNPAFVTRAIQSGKISGAALVGEGRSARIRVAVALEQLGQALDLGQQLAQARPILPDVARGVSAPAPSTAVAGEDLLAGATVDADGDDGDAPAGGLHMRRDQQLELRNRKLQLEIEAVERQQAIACGELVLARDVETAIRRQVQPLVATFDEVPAAVAKAVSEAHGIVYAEVLITIKGALREQRAAWAQRARAFGEAVA